MITRTKKKKKKKEKERKKERKKGSRAVFRYKALRDTVERKGHDFLVRISFVHSLWWPNALRAFHTRAKTFRGGAKRSQ